MTHSKRNEFSPNNDSLPDGHFVIGKGDTGSPTQTKEFAPWYYSGGALPFPNNNIVLDITEFSPINENIFLEAYDGWTSTTGTLNSFSVEFYDTYDPSGATGKVITSSDPPKPTIQGANIYATCDMTPVLYVNPISHDFGTMNEGQTDSWSFDITNTGGGTLSWNVSESLSWVTSVDPASGTTVAETDSVTVNIDTTGLAPGHYDGNISVTSDGGSQDVYVEVTVAEESTWTFKRLTNNSGTSSDPSVAASGDNLYVAWSDNTKGNGEIYMYYSHDGATTWNFKRITNNVGESVAPSVSVDGNNVYVVWSDNTPGNYEIFLDYKKGIV